MMKNMVLATNFGKANEMNLCEKEMGFLVRDKDYQNHQRPSERNGTNGSSRWLAMQDEHLRFSVACLMAPEKAKKICECENRCRNRLSENWRIFSGKEQNFLADGMLISGMITGTISCTL